VENPAAAIFAKLGRYLADKTREEGGPEIVSDARETAILIREKEIFSPEYIAETVVPELDKYLELNAFRIKGYYLWPEYQVGGYDKLHTRPDGSY